MLCNNYFGETVRSSPQLFTPIIYIGFGSLFYNLMGILIIISFIYLIFSSLLLPYNKDKTLLYVIACFFLLTLVPSFIQINSFPKQGVIMFIISVIPFFVFLLILLTGMFGLK